MIRHEITEHGAGPSGHEARHPGRALPDEIFQIAQIGAEPARLNPHPDPLKPRESFRLDGQID